MIKTMVRPSTRPPRTEDRPAKIILTQRDKIKIKTSNIQFENRSIQFNTHNRITTEHLVIVTAVE